MNLLTLTACPYRVVRIREGQLEGIQNRDELDIEEGTIEFSH